MKNEETRALNEETRIMNEQTRLMGQNAAPKAQAAAPANSQPKAEETIKPNAKKDAKDSKKGAKKDSHLGQTIAAGVAGAAMGAGAVAFATSASAAPHKSTLSTGATPNPDDTSSPTAVDAQMTEEERNPESHEPQEYVKGVSPEPTTSAANSHANTAAATTGAENTPTTHATTSGATATTSVEGHVATAEPHASDEDNLAAGSIHARVNNTETQHTTTAETTHTNADGSTITTTSTHTTTTTTTSTYTQTTQNANGEIIDVQTLDDENHHIATVSFEDTPYGEENQRVIDFLMSKGMTEEQVEARFSPEVLAGGESIYDSMTDQQVVSLRALMAMEPEPAVPGETIPEPGDIMLINSNGIHYAHVDDDMSFSEAFAEARDQVGPGGAFIWRGNTYGTYYAEEWDNMSTSERGDFVQAVNFDDTYESLAEQNSNPIETYMLDDEPEFAATGTFEDDMNDNDMVHVLGADDDSDIQMFSFDDDVVYDTEWESDSLFEPASYDMEFDGDYDLAADFDDMSNNLLDDLMDTGDLL